MCCCTEHQTCAELRLIYPEGPCSRLTSGPLFSLFSSPVPPVHPDFRKVEDLESHYIMVERQKVNPTLFDAMRPADKKWTPPHPFVAWRGEFGVGVGGDR